MHYGVFLYYFPNGGRKARQSQCQLSEFLRLEDPLKHSVLISWIQFSFPQSGTYFRTIGVGVTIEFLKVFLPKYKKNLNSARGPSVSSVICIPLSLCVTSECPEMSQTPLGDASSPLQRGQVRGMQNASRFYCWLGAHCWSFFLICSVNWLLNHPFRNITWFGFR